MSTGELGSWESSEYVAEWIGQDVLADFLRLPRRISASLVADAGLSVSHVVDLGAGTGSYLEVLLDAFPGSRGTWVDASEAMREAAEDALSRFGERVEFVVGDAEQLAELPLDGADVLVTSRVVHHFSPESIARLYRAGYELLSPGGYLFNLDHVGVPGDWEQRYRRIRREFTGRPKTEARPHRHDYPLRPVDEHLAWLTEAGFEAPDTPWRTFFTALLAARKPA